MLPQEAKEKAAKRASLLASLAKTALPAEHQRLIKSSGALNKKMTMKERLRTALRRERLGLPAEDSVPLRRAVDRRGSAEWKAATSAAAAVQDTIHAGDAQPQAPPAPPAVPEEGKPEVEAQDAPQSDCAEEGGTVPESAAGGDSDGGEAVPKVKSSGGFTVRLPKKLAAADDELRPAAAREAAPAAKAEPVPAASKQPKAEPAATGSAAFEVKLPAASDAAGGSGAGDAKPVADRAAVLNDDGEIDPVFKRLLALRARNREIAEAAAKAAEQGGDGEQSDASDAASDDASERSFRVVEDLTEQQLTSNRKMLKKSAAEDSEEVGQFVVKVKRDSRIQAARMQLPVCGMEQEIMEAILANDVVIISGETGSGKTTQVPQFLYEAGFGSPNIVKGMIGVTQPRRVAAVAMGQRVAQELNVKQGKKGEVGHQIRHDASTVGKNTRIKFMTDGILLREIQDDLLLRQYSAIVLDEAHERNLNTDVLIGMLSRALPLRNKLAERQVMELERKRIREGTGAVAGDDDAEDGALAVLGTDRILPLKLIIMSATLRVEDFTNNRHLFASPPPVITVSARQHPVSVHFARRTEMNDYVGEAYAKTVSIHRKLPEGGVLVFLTGQQEIEDLVARLRKKFNAEGIRKRAAEAKRRRLAAKAHERPAKATDGDDESGDGSGESSDSHSESDDSSSDDDAQDGDEAAVPGQKRRREEKPADAAEDEEEEEPDKPMHVLPLYALLPRAAQLAVFEPPPPGHRLVVVATNVAETSVTIPNIKYVVDSGRAKRRVYDMRSGASKFVVDWISKASADQRSGRAGRTGPGHTYRLYSSAVYNDQFAQFEEPEILVQPIEGMVLNLKTMGINAVQAFPFPTPPAPAALAAAIRDLEALGAITRNGPRDDDPSGVASVGERLTPLGRQLAQFPVAPRFAKMLVLGAQGGCLPFVHAIVAAMTVQDVMIRPRLSAPGASRQKKATVVKADGEEDVESDDPTDYEDEGDEPDAPKNEAEERERAARMRAVEAARTAHARWRHAQSDVLTLLRIVGSHSHEAAAGRSATFAKKNWVRLKGLREIEQLRAQLQRITDEAQARSGAKRGAKGGAGGAVDDVATGSRDVDEEDAVKQVVSASKRGAAPPLAPPTLSQETLLRQVIAGGLLDRVARKAPPEVVTAAIAAGGAKSGGHLAYECASASIEGVVFVHPSSAVKAGFAEMPEYVVCNEVVHGSRPWMRGVTQIDPSWLPRLAAGTPLCSLSDPLETPQPFYDADRDEVRCSVTPTFGDRAWKLPAFEIKHPTGEASCRWFARALLEGSVISAFKQLTPLLKSRPVQITRRALEKRVVLLVDALSRATPQIDCLDTLRARWSHDPTFLQDLVAMWLPKDKHAALASIWALVVHSEVGDGAGDASDDGAAAAAGAGGSDAAAGADDSPPAAAKASAGSGASQPQKGKKARKAKKQKPRKVKAVAAKDASRSGERKAKKPRRA